MGERLTHPQSRLLEPTQLVVLGGIAALVGLTWLDLWRRAREMAMHEAMGMAMPSQAPWDLGDLGTTAVMWGVMMVAMMLPSATPLLVLFARSQRPRVSSVEGSVRTGLLAAGYLVVWLGWSGLAAALQWVLHASLLLSPRVALTSALAGGALLVLTGLYQISPWKYACLTRCQSPLGFMLTHWREGRRDALWMGAAHGAYCVGCCWALMVLLFVGGVMNLNWIGALAVLVLHEKVVPGRWVSPMPRAARWSPGVSTCCTLGSCPHLDDLALSRLDDGFERDAQALAHLLSHPEQAIAWGENGRSHARVAFGWSRCASEYEAVYAEATRCATEGSAATPSRSPAIRALFPAEQLRVYLYEDWNASPERVWRELMGYLDLNSSYVPDFGERHNETRAYHPGWTAARAVGPWLKRALPTRVRPRVRRGLERLMSYQPRLDPAARHELTYSLFREDILRLQDMLRRDLSRWLD